MENKNTVLAKKNLLVLLRRLLIFNIFLLACIFSNGIGCFTPTFCDCLEITVIRIRLEDELETFTDTQLPPEGKAFVVVDTAIKVLKDVHEKELDLGLIYLLNEEEEIVSELKGYGGIGTDAIVCNVQNCYGGCHLILKEGRDYYLGFVFLIDEIEVNQTFAISFPNSDPIKVSFDY